MDLGNTLVFGLAGLVAAIVFVALLNARRGASRNRAPQGRGRHRGPRGRGGRTRTGDTYAYDTGLTTGAIMAASTGSHSHAATHSSSDAGGGHGSGSGGGSYDGGGSSDSGGGGDGGGGGGGD